jgi:hypothetical protein
MLLIGPLLHLNAQRADAACASHHDRLPGTTQANQEHAHHAAVPADAPADEQCETPAQMQCCHALVSCALDLGLRDAEAGSQTASSRERQREMEGQTPSSRVSSPEPPPPRA